MAGRNVHVAHRQRGDDGDDGRLAVVTGPLESDNQKRRKQVGRQHQQRPIAHITHEYLAPYRSHAHCQMRSMPRD